MAIDRQRPIAREARLWAGLVLMAFATTHLLNHAFGLVSIEAMEAARGWLGFWHTNWGWPVLLLAFTVHVATTLAGLYQRRSLGLEPWQLLQLGSGLLIPLLLAIHYVGSRGLILQNGISTDYFFELQVIWPDHAVRQTLLVLVVWLHGCVGLHYWWRLRPWYAAARGPLLALAVVIPTLSLAGFVTAARGFHARAAADPAWVEGIGRNGRWPVDWSVIDWVYVADKAIIGGFLGIVLAVLLARAARIHWLERGRRFAVTYPDGKLIRAPIGASLLEASRLAGVPHASVCGARGRCSTCRVRINKGLEALPAPLPGEVRVLERLRAAPDVRLACQTRPAAALAITPLVPVEAQGRHVMRRMDPGQGVEREVAVLFVDLRGFTRISEGRLPYDIVHLLNRYFKTMGSAIDGAGGHVDKVVGDGIMALFGLATDPATASRQALRAVKAMGEALDGLNQEFAGDLAQPLRMAVGLHQGTAIVGELGYGASTALTAIGDAVNVASRLEGVAKDHDVELAVSAAVLDRAGVPPPDGERRDVAIRGRRQPLPVSLVRRAGSLQPMPGEAASEPLRRLPAWRWRGRARGTAG